MKALFVGLGSIGRRHLRLLRELTEVEILWCRSGQGASGAEWAKDNQIKMFEDLSRAMDEGPDFAVISNPTSLHVETAITLAPKGIPLLIEKPLSDRMEGLDILKGIVEEKSLPVMVGFQLRHHPGFQFLLELLRNGDLGKPLSLQGYVGQYLPDWRPSVDYQKCYSARKDLGGGVILDLCHEIDIAVSILGKVHKVSCFCDHYSDLRIETEDMAEITMEHQDGGLSHLHLDYVEKGYEWATRVLCSAGTVTWDCGKGYVEWKRADGRVQRKEDPGDFNRDSLFREQLRHWLRVLDGKTAPSANLAEGIFVTEVALAAKRSSREKRHIEL